MDEAWERAVEAARGGEEPSSIRSITLDGALKCSQGRLPAPSLLEQFTQLRVLSIANVNLSSLVDFPSLPHLERLILSDNRISGGLEHLVQAGLSSLRDLDLSNNKIQLLEDLAPLAGLNLLSLDLYECPVTRFPEYRSKVFVMIKSLEYLDKLDAYNNERPETDEEEEDDEEEDDDVEDELADGVEEEYEDRGKISARNERLQEDGEGEEEEDEGEDSDEDDAGGVQHPVVGRAHVNHDQGKEESSSEEEVDDEDDDEDDVEDEGDSDNAEVNDAEESEEEEDGEEEEEDEEEDEGTQQARGNPEGEIDAQGEEEEEDEYGEVGDEEDEEEDYGTEYLVQPIRQAEEEEAASDFEPGDDDDEEEEDDDEENDDDEEDEDSAPPSKRKREDDGKDGRPSKK